MNKLEAISEYLKTAKIEELENEALDVTGPILTEIQAVRYPFELFVSKWYIPFRAFHTFGVDTIQLAQYLQNGNPIYGEWKETIKSSLYGEWIAVCVHALNNVSLYDTKTNRHLMYLPPMVRTPFVRQEVDNRKINVTNFLAGSIEKFSVGRYKESHDYAKYAMVEANRAYDYKSFGDSLRADWIKSLDFVDQLLGRKPEDMIEQIKSYLPMENIKIENVKNLEDRRIKTKAEEKQDILAAFE